MAHKEHERKQKNVENGIQPDEKEVPLSAYARTVYVLLQAGAQLNQTTSSLNPATAHLKPSTIEES